MMKKSVAVAMMMFAAVCAFAGDFEPYVGLKVGMTDTCSNLFVPSGTSRVTIENNEQLTFAAVSAGARFNFLRAELDYTLKSNGSYGNDTNLSFSQSVQTYLFNLYIDFPVDFIVKPFFNAGLGISTVKFNVSDSNVLEASDELFTYVLGLGITYDLTRHLDLDLGYRYTKIDDLSIKKDLMYVFNFSNDIYFGARYTF